MRTRPTQRRLNFHGARRTQLYWGALRGWVWVVWVGVVGFRAVGVEVVGVGAVWVVGVGCFKCARASLQF